MHYFKKMHYCILSIMLFSSMLSARSEITLDYHYKNAFSNEMVSLKNSINLNASIDSKSEMKIDKTLFVIKMAKKLKSAVKAFHDTCNNDLNFPASLPHLPPEPNNCTQEREEVALYFLSVIQSLNIELDTAPHDIKDEKLYETLDLFRKLAQNMRNYRDYIPPVRDVMPAPGSGAPAMPAPPSTGAPAVTTGGAQDFAFVRKLINDGGVPSEEDILIKGFMAQFNLSLSKTPCDQLICFTPEYKVDTQEGKLFVQVGMTSNLIESSFRRRPLNLSLVIDISGSMSNRDDTEKSRLEWAKDAAIKAIRKLRASDYLSVITFETKSEVIIPSTKIKNESHKENLIQSIHRLTTKGSTNLYAGLNSGFESVGQTAYNLEGYNSRVILISDAGLNTGITSQADTLRLITNYANRHIGLTAIGLGSNFNQEFIRAITMSQGGNYIYAHSGADMFNYFEEFKFLVEPVAYQLNVNINLHNLDATLNHVYGIPMPNDQAPATIIQAQTLFFTNQGGGAILLEYDLN